MSDIIDRACELEQKQREQALAASQPKLEQPHEHDGHRYCLTCSIEIPTKRLTANPNAVRCIDCQVLAEIKNKRAEW